MGCYLRIFAQNPVHEESTINLLNKSKPTLFYIILTRQNIRKYVKILLTLTKIYEKINSTTYFLLLYQLIFIH
jgi:hypothetical protein